MRVYLAASLFTPFERQRNKIVGETLSAAVGASIFLPQTIRDEGGRRPTAERIFSECVEGLQTADVVVALVDGADVDSGVSWELGYAFARSLPIVIVRTDYRRAEAGSVNIMIEGCASVRVHETHPSASIEAVTSAVTAAVINVARGTVT